MNILMIVFILVNFYLSIYNLLYIVNKLPVLKDATESYIVDLLFYYNFWDVYKLKYKHK